MYTAIIKLNSLSDAVRSAAEDHDLRLVIIYRILIFGIVGGVVICAVLGTAYMNALPCLFHAETDSLVPDVFFRNFQNLAQIFIGKSIFLCRDQRFIRRKLAFILHQSLFLFHEFLHLLYKIMFYFRNFMNFFYCCTFPECLIHHKMPFTGRSDQKSQEFFF